MHARQIGWLLALGATLLAHPAAAQFIPIPFDTPSIMAPVVINPCPGGRCVATPGQAVAPHPAAPSPRPSLTYTPSPATLATAEADYLNRLRRTSPDMVAPLSEQMRLRDFGQVYSAIVAPYGLRRSDAGDAVTAHTILAWMIANDQMSSGPTAREVQRLRARIGDGLAARRRLADPATRTALGEEVAITFVTLHAGWQSARREGGSREYANGVAAMFRQQTGDDLRGLVLTDRGLEPRG